MTANSEEQTPDQDLEPTPLSSLENESSHSPDEALNAPNVTIGTIVSIGSLFMFIGGALVTLMLLARAFELHGQTLVIFVVASCSVVLGMAGYLIAKIMGDKPMIGAFAGALFGAVTSFVFYLQTKSYSWWM